MLSIQVVIACVLVTFCVSTPMPGDTTPAFQSPPPSSPSPSDLCPDSVSMQCPAEDTEVVAYLPYPGECHMFCECSNGVAYAQHCAGGLAFDSKRNACDRAALERCPPGDVAPGSQPAQNACIDSVSAQCPKMNHPQVEYLPNPVDCHSFCECSNGVAYQIECPLGLIYNTTAAVCTFGDESSC